MFETAELSEKELQTLLASAALTSMDNIQEVFRAVYVEDKSPLMAFFSTLMRLKLLEITVLRAAADEFKLSPETAATISEDARKAMLIFLASSGSLAKETAASMGGAEVSAAMVELGRLQDAESSPSPHEFAGRLSEFHQDLLKMRETDFGKKPN